MELNSLRPYRIDPPCALNDRDSKVWDAIFEAGPRTAAIANIKPNPFEILIDALNSLPVLDRGASRIADNWSEGAGKK